MPFQVSPGVNVSEIDLTTIVPAVSTSIGGIAGTFRWGPIGERILIDSEIALAQRFGKPTNHNAETWFTAASFLSYTNALYVSRAANTTGNSTISAFNAVANVGSVANIAAQVVKNETDFTNKDGTFDTDVIFLARFPGAMGNSLRVSVCDTANAFQNTYALYDASTPTLDNQTAMTLNVGSNSATFTFHSTSNTDVGDTLTQATEIYDSIAVNDLLLVGNSLIGTQYMKVTAKGTLPVTGTANATGGWTIFTVNFEDTLKLHSSVTSNAINRTWEFYNLVDTAPGTSDYVAAFGNSAAKDEMHIVVVDEGGLFSGVPGTVLEVYKNVSRATDAKTSDGATNHYKAVINDVSPYIWSVNDRSNAVSATALNIVSSTNNSALNLRFVEGTDGYTEVDLPNSILLSAYDLFQSAEDIDISFILAGKSLNTAHVNYLIDNIAENRKDCVVFASPQKGNVVNNPDAAQSVVTFRNTLRSTSYAVLDSGYKYMYDKYNDVYRWIPLNGDTAGLCARTDLTNDPWWSPAGYNRGQIKNIVRLAYNPRKADRDLLYKNGVNPVVTFPGQGTVLYGDKTLLAKPSAFDRINVRRLFIVLEKAISTAAKYTLFEFNDAFTRSQFKNLVNPYLRDIQGRRGITDFLVVCDESNNTGEVIDRNEFIGDIYIKPARSINFIQLNFVAVRTGVQFAEVVGQF
jgi:phage tail sheath protein FI